MKLSVDKERFLFIMCKNLVDDAEADLPGTICMSLGRTDI